LLRNLGYRAVVVGIFIAIGEGAGILAPFLLGRFADRSGNYKSCIIFAWLITASVTIPIAHVTNPIITVILIVLLTVGYRSVTPLLDAMTTINLGEKSDYGKIRVFGSVAFVFIMFFMQWVPVIRPNTPGNISFWMCLTCVLAIITAFIVPSRYSRLKPQKEKSAAISETDSADILKAASLKKSIKNSSIWTPVFILGLTSIALSRLAMTPTYSFFSLFLVEYMQWDAVGLMFGIASISEIPFMYFSYRLIRRFGAMRIVAFASAIVALRLGLYAIFPFKAGVICAQLLHSLCFGIFHPAAIAFITSNVPAEKRSFGMSLYMSVGWGIPTFIGNFIGGFIVEYAGFLVLFGSFTIFAIMGAAIYFIYLIFQRKNG